MQCIIETDNNQQITLLSESVSKRTLYSVERKFESIITTLLHKSGSMPPIIIPKFDISSFISSASSNANLSPPRSPILRQQSQETDVSSVCAVYEGETAREITPKPINSSNRNHSHSNNSPSNHYNYSCRKRKFQHVSPFNNYRQIMTKRRLMDNRFRRQKHVNSLNIKSVIQPPPNKNILPVLPLGHPIYPTHPQPYYPNYQIAHQPYYNTKSQQIRTMDTRTHHLVLANYIRPRSDKLKYGEARLTDITQHNESKSICKTFLEHTQAARLDVYIMIVYKIQNEKLSEEYKHRRKSIKRGLDGDECKLNERYLFHGTNLSVIPKIITQGFLRQFTQRHAFGQGCYFAVNAAYSAHPRYSTPNTEGTQFVFVCSVICGEYCKGNAAMKVPDIKPNTDNILYETTCNDVDRPSVFVTFSDNQAIPVYLIAFKNRRLSFS